MSPPIQKDWWLAAALTGAALPAAMGQVPTAAESRPTAGIVTSVSQGASATDGSTPIYIDNASGQRLTTGPDQTMHVLFSDQSALTIGPNSSVVISEYRYDTATRDGVLVVDLNQGVVRVVGGFISKQNETVVRAPGVGSFGIRGGITTAERGGGTARAVFLFGQSMRASGEDGQQTQTVTRQGFGVSIQDNQVSSPQLFSSTDLTAMMGRLGAQSNSGSQGSPNPSPAPSGQLISTGNSGGGTGGGSPGSTLANDRLRNVNDTGPGSANTSSDPLRNILGTSQTPVQS
ncbi:FecR domain-containing protein [Acidovorax sp. sic0104]|uniref:FecR domain-containing protein n=1 Tax=Acidovorax sp. sic0104 TaxID=2854784 RepID=UPI001C4833AA|nr:FecR domain-containing protein [Acidovorax sp. sic0104]MBV7540377.1 FecR domain-containing protein [Acidovorax sp. sic0104]